jgi:hypothetical protein
MHLRHNETEHIRLLALRQAIFRYPGNSYRAFLKRLSEFHETKTLKNRLSTAGSGARRAERKSNATMENRLNRVALLGGGGGRCSSQNASHHHRAEKEGQGLFHCVSPKRVETKFAPKINTSFEFQD